MMSNFRFMLLMVFMGSLLFTCKTKQLPAEISFSKNQSLVLLDSAAAAQVVVVDKSENFFGQVGILDMKIQMKRNYPEAASREEILADYQLFLQQDVGTFSPTEKESLQAVFKKAFELCQGISPDIFPKKLQLIKSKGQPYGAATFYTRDNSIVIPEGLLAPDNSGMLQVALHEIFHIYSRYHPAQKNKLYELIGFKPVEKNLLALPDSLQYRLLLNPDGIDYGYIMKVKNPEGKEIQAIPLIVSNKMDFDPADPVFFSYLQFDLYQIRAPFVQRIEVMANSDGSSTIDFQQMPDFFRQIKDNTGYIIHPDEIMADNFVLVATRQESPEFSLSLSKEGQTLLDQVEQVLKSPMNR